MVSTQMAQEGLKIWGTRSGAAEQQAPTGVNVERTKEHPLGIAAADRHLGLLAAQRPSRPQRGQQPQGRFIFGQQHGARGSLF
jgi:hypothetical protein